MGDNESCKTRVCNMSIVVLASGGLDSTLISVMAEEEGVETFPLFIDYGVSVKRTAP